MPYSDIVIDLWVIFENIMLFVLAIFILVGIELGTHRA